MLPATPTRLGRYEILDELGKGAAGVVFLARDPLIGRLVALKTFRVGYSVKDHELQQFRARFIREAQSAGILSHANIVTIHDVVEESDDGVAFIAMEYVRGTNLKQLLQGGTPLDLPFAAEIVRQVGEALDYAHSKGVVHRDVKPANIIITADNRVKITDFGIARIDASNLTQEGQLLGTPNYMAPEQILGREVDHRADLFSLGVVLYEMLTRHKPFQGENLTVVSHRIVYDQFTPPRQYVRELPSGVERILNKALAKDPAQRYQRGRDLIDDLRRITGDHRPLPEADSLNETQSLAATAVLSESPVVHAAAGGGRAGRARWRRWLGGRRQTAATPVPALAPRRAPVAAPAPIAAVPAVAARADASSPAAGVEETVSSGLAEVVPLVPAGARSPAPPSRRSFGRRLAALAAVAVAVPVLAVAAAVLLVSWGEPPPVAADVHPQVVPLLTRGMGLLLSGHAPEAAAAFTDAERLAPQVAVIGRLRRTAEARSQDSVRRAAVEQEIAAQTEVAATALADRAWDQADAAANRLLELDPNHPGAPQILAEVAAGRARQAAPRPRQPAPATAAAEEPAPAPVQPSMPAPTVPAHPQDDLREATLTVDFYSELDQGILIVYFGPDRLLVEQFDFRDRRGLLRPRRSAGGGSFRRSYKVTPGQGALRVHVTPTGQAAKVQNLAGNFPGGAERRLVIQLSADGRATARLH